MLTDFTNASTTQGGPAPKIAVVTPVYNAEMHLIDAVDSVYAQGLPAGFFEHIIVDDKFTDGNAAKQAEHERVFRELYRRMDTGIYPNLRIINSGENGRNNGQSNARNAGIQEARAPYIACLDADDMYAFDPVFLRINGSFLKRAADDLDRDERLAFVSPSLLWFGAGKFNAYLPTAHSSDEIIKTTTLSLGTGNIAAFRREDALAAGGYNPKHTTREDSPFFVKLLYSRFIRGKDNRIKSAIQADYIYRRHYDPNDHVHGRHFSDQDLEELQKETIAECLPLYQRYYGEKTVDEIYTDIKDHEAAEAENYQKRMKSWPPKTKLGEIYWSIKARYQWKKYVMRHYGPHMLQRPKFMVASAIEPLSKRFPQSMRETFDLLADPRQYYWPSSKRMGIDYCDGLPPYTAPDDHMPEITSRLLLEQDPS